MSKRTNGTRKVRNRTSFCRRNWRSLGLALPAAGGLALGIAPAAQAFQVYDGTQSGANNLIIHLDITTSYAGMYRVGSPSATLVSGTTNANGNDGDANFRHGLVSNDFSILPVLDIKDQNFGMHFSGEYFINTVYLQGNQNNQPLTVNPILPKNTDFASETRQADGMNGRMLDAFVYDSWNFGPQQVLTVKVGKQTLFWGQSLFTTDGISGGQAPIDTVQAQNLVNAEVQQIYLPVGQAVVTFKPDATYTLQGYYQFEWEPYSLQGVGSFFSTSDVTGPGGQRLILAAPIPAYGFPGLYVNRTRDLTPETQNGQFGLSIQAQYGNYDVGVFGLRYDSKTPVLQLGLNLAPPTFAAPSGGVYRLLYPRDIWLGGTSVSTTIGATNVAAEFSVRTHDPLVTGSTTSVSILGSPYNYGDANGNPLYPVGNVATGLVNFIYGSPSLPLDPGGVTMLGEVVYEDVIGGITNKAALQPGRSSAAAEFDVEAIPAYNSVLPFLNISFPIGFQYNFAGNSEADSTMNHGTGSWNISVDATYRTVWTAELSYVSPFGKVTTNPLLPETRGGVDRHYLELAISRTF